MGWFFINFALAFVGIIVSSSLRYLACVRTKVSNAGNTSIKCYLHRILARNSLNNNPFYGVCNVTTVFSSGVDFDKVVRTMIGITLFQSAYTAEAVRGGLQAIDKGSNRSFYGSWPWLLEENYLYYIASSPKNFYTSNC